MYRKLTIKPCLILLGLSVLQLTNTVLLIIHDMSTTGNLLNGITIGSILCTLGILCLTFDWLKQK